MKKVIFGIFAHPDDEAFCPSAYLYRQAQSGADVHLVVATDGDAGRNEGYENLAEQRHAEWLESGRRIGAASNLALHYPDGGLCNNLYLEIAGLITNFIHETLHGYDQPVDVELVTLEQAGITGHLDHIAISFITTYVFEQLKTDPPANTHVGRLLYYCLPKALAPECDCNWLYMPAGRSDAEIDFTHNFADIADKKLHIMQAHESQKKDMEEVILAHANDPSLQAACTTDHFIVRT